LKNSPKEVTLADQGIDRNLANRARKAVAKKKDGTFEAELEKKQRLAVAAAEGNKEVVAEARRERGSRGPSASRCLNLPLFHNRFAKFADCCPERCPAGIF
jgi:hypothetical protein